MNNPDILGILKLIYLVYQNPKILKTPKNNEQLQNYWEKIKKEITPLFQGFAYSFELILKSFENAILSIDPKIYLQYDSEKNMLSINFISLFFSLITDNYVIPNPPWLLGGKLMHEYEHYKFCLNEDLIGENKKSNPLSRNKNELNALTKEVEFYVHCKKLVLNKPLYGLYVSKWSSEGEPIIPKVIPIVNNQEMLNQWIIQGQQRVDYFSNIDEYSKNETKISEEHSVSISKVLSLQENLIDNKINMKLI